MTHHQPTELMYVSYKTRSTVTSALVSSIVFALSPSVFYFSLLNPYSIRARTNYPFAKRRSSAQHRRRSCHVHYHRSSSPTPGWKDDVGSICAISLPSLSSSPFRSGFIVHATAERAPFYTLRPSSPPKNAMREARLYKGPPHVGRPRVCRKSRAMVCAPQFIQI